MPPGKKGQRMSVEKRLLTFRYIDDNGCWIFAGAKARTGYGMFSMHGNRGVAAHRVSYELFIGDIPDGAYILHECDVPACFNPDHLRAGTQAENMDDMRRKGRSGKQVLLPSDVEEIRRRYIAPTKGNAEELAREFGVSVGHIRAVGSGRLRKNG